MCCNWLKKVISLLANIIFSETPRLATTINPLSSWERGLNENTNGLLRQYFPKGSDFITLTDADVNIAMEKLNHRPRKFLGYKIPNQVFLGINPPVALECWNPRNFDSQFFSRINTLISLKNIEPNETNSNTLVIADI
jgi:hypothetical protein